MHTTKLLEKIFGYPSKWDDVLNCWSAAGFPQHSRQVELELELEHVTD
jgi:hypothetical protein